MSNAVSSASRPASSGGRWPAPGAYGLRTGSTSRTVSARIGHSLDFVRGRSTCRHILRGRGRTTFGRWKATRPRFFARLGLVFEALDTAGTPSASPCGWGQEEDS
jgi:hypothetical protein